MISLRPLAVRLRANQLFYHSCHNLVDGQSFFADHEFLGEAYTQAEADYDSVIERMIGAGQYQELQLSQLAHDVAEKLEGAPSIEQVNAYDYMTYALKIELGTNQMIEALCKSEDITEGTRQLIGEIANKAEVRIYKLQARLQQR